RARRGAGSLLAPTTTALSPAPGPLPARAQWGSARFVLVHVVLFVGPLMVTPPMSNRTCKVRLLPARARTAVWVAALRLTRFRRKLAAKPLSRWCAADGYRLR